MEKKKVLNIPGTKPSARNSQLLISTGIPAFDELSGGGLPVGTVMLIDEDTYGSYSKVLMKYFLAEGVVSNHVSFVADLDSDPEDIVNQLPSVKRHEYISNIHAPKTDTKAEDKMKIAFRYERLPTEERHIKPSFGNYYDLSKYMPAEDIKKAECHYYKQCDLNANDTGLIDNPTFGNLLERLSNLVSDSRFVVDDKFDEKNVLRVCIRHLGSPMWNTENTFGDLCTFVYYLKCLMRKCFGVAMVSIPSHLSGELQKIFNYRLIHTSDIAIKLEVFAGTNLERNKSLADYHGFFHIIKIAAINSLKSCHPGSVEYTFKMKVRKFCIEKLHLPPDIEEDGEDNKKRTPSLACGSSSSHKLEF